ncbi:MAG TPA: hypothetical protein VMT95_01590 [Candidatus Binatia bacterium]|nr:hypothetical protein [Candidatus Binatia bacterium]
MKRLNLGRYALSIGAAAALLAGCGGPQPSGPTTFPQVQQEDPVSTPLPSGTVLHRASQPLPRQAMRQPLLYMGDTAGAAIDIYPLTGPNKQRIGRITNGVVDPWGLSLDANNTLYVANLSRTVRVYPNGSSSPSMTYSRGLHEALYAVADSAGHVLVADTVVGGPKKGGLVIEYNAGTNVPIKKVRLGAEEDGMAQDASGNLYVAYRRTSRTGIDSSIAEFGPGLTNKRLLGMTINQPQGLVVDSSGNLVVAESQSDDIKVFPPGATTPSVTVKVPANSNIGELAMQNNETTLWVSSEGGDVYSMPYPLTPSTIPTVYEHTYAFSNGVAVTH